MTKPGDILRKARRQLVGDVRRHIEQANQLEAEAAAHRKAAAEALEAYDQCGQAIKRLEGDNAVLDTPGEI